MALELSSELVTMSAGSARTGVLVAETSRMPSTLAARTVRARLDS